MYILGDIGNTETKIFLVSKNNKILKKINFSSKDINHIKLSKFFNNFIYKRPRQLGLFLLAHAAVISSNPFTCPFRIST